MKMRTIALSAIVLCTIVLAALVLGRTIELLSVGLAALVVVAAWLRLVRLLAEREAGLTTRLVSRLPQGAPVAGLDDLHETLTVAIARVPGEVVQP